MTTDELESELAQLRAEIERLQASLPCVDGRSRQPGGSVLRVDNQFMDIEQLTIGEARAIAALFQGQPVAPASSHPFEIGKVYFIRTVTHHLTGKLVEVFPSELVLVDGAWIADDGRLADALKSGTFAEVEPFPGDTRIVIGRGSIIDAQVLAHKAPRSQK